MSLSQNLLQLAPSVYRIRSGRFFLLTFGALPIPQKILYIQLILVLVSYQRAYVLLLNVKKLIECIRSVRLFLHKTDHIFWLFNSNIPLSNR